MRRIADAIDYSAPALYHHFVSKDDLLDQIRHRGYKIFLPRLSDIQDFAPKKRIIAMVI
jgi:AcrR family transcriptional regulator